MVLAGTSNAPITLNYSKKVIKSGETLKLKVQKRDYKRTDDIYGSWYSSNENIISVDQKGVVTARESGTATITYSECRVPENEMWCYYPMGEVTCTITVKRGKYKVNKTKIEVLEGKSVTVKASTAAEYSTRYRGLDDSYGDVEIEGDSKKGTATITLLIDGVVLKLKVRVTNPQVSELLLPVTKGSMKKIHLVGTNQYSVVKYKSSDRKTVLVSKNGTVKGVKYGTATITIEVDHKVMTVPVSVCTKKVAKAIGYGVAAYGATYSQSMRMSQGYYDCSSLVWRSYHSAGVNFGASGWAPTAAELAEYCVNHKLAISYEALEVDQLKPGDLVFFSRDNNGRYRNIYHVAMYIGTREDSSWGDTYKAGLLLEARNEGVGIFDYNMYARKIEVIARPV